MLFILFPPPCLIFHVYMILKKNKTKPQAYLLLLNQVFLINYRTGDTISGLTNNGTESGTIVWTPTATGTYYYQCSLHGGMVGTITIQ